MDVPPFKKVILERLKGALRPQGFRKNASTYIRSVEECFQIVNLQASQFGTRADQSYTVNLAIYCPRVQPLGKDAAKLKEYEGHWQARIGKFLPSGENAWWRVASVTDAENAAKEIVQALPIALVTMDAISTYDALIRIPPGAGTSSDDPPGHCRWPLINAAREREGLPPVKGFKYTEGWRDSWHRRQYP